MNGMGNGTTSLRRFDDRERLTVSVMRLEEEEDDVEGVVEVVTE